ncbi:RNA polymerase sigma factor [Sphingomonas sp. Root241]|uniref:RNA polymerase sigma factor n=1 Tax=Sphingomonas sp. Root241 TaxID=1736501 RepID=UPI0006FA1125|nr:RNA polymerase sigma factor [Sphingomonas sp. Root241]KRC81108.1 RNA polymerase subunit sigma-24 [Sphingomonas sp. Root241]
MSLNLSALSDGELAILSLDGRDAAYAEIMRRHRDAIFRIVAGNIGDPEEALDLVQETFVAAHRALGRYDALRPMRRWLARIALNKCRDWRRRRMVRRLFAFALPLDSSSAEVPEDRALPDAEAADRAEVRRVAAAIAELPAALREPLVLRAVEDMSQAETAAILGITEKAVETRLRRARAKLSERLNPS